MILICVWNVTLHSILSLHTNGLVAQSSLGVSDEQTQPATASKHAHSTKIAAERANHAIIRSPKNHPCARLRQARLNRLLRVITTQNKSPPLLRNRRQPYKMT